MGRLLGTENFMRRYWIEQKKLTETQGEIDGENFHHIIEVCRQNVGSRFELLTENHEAFLVEISEISKKTAQVQIIEKRLVPPLAKPKIRLCLSVPRFPVFENVIEKAVELGVFDIHLFFSEYSFVKTREKVSADKLERWNRIVKSSTQQSGRGDLMKIHPPISFQDLNNLINRNLPSACLFAYEGDGHGQIPSTPLSETLEKMSFRELEEIYVIVGSEGGFSTQEANFMLQQGHNPVHFGQQILRVETACVALVSILKYKAGL